MEKGFYLLTPEKVKYFEGLLEAMKTLEKNGIWLSFPKEEKNEKGEMKLVLFTLWFEVVEKEENFYVRMRLRGGDKKVISEKLLPSSKTTPKKFFEPIRDYLDQKLKKEKLTVLLTINETHLSQNDKLYKHLTDYHESYERKLKAIDSEIYERAGNLVDILKDILEKIVAEVKKEQGFNWVTNDHVKEILEE